MSAADPAKITGISSMATREVLAELGARFERRSGHAVAFESVGGADAAKRVASGEPFDVVVLASDAIDKLIEAGRIVAGSKAALARSGVAIAVRSGAPRPEIGSEEAVRRAVLSARSVGYSTGPSGVDYTTAPKALEDWRNRQIAGIKDPAAMPKVGDLRMSDDELRESIESNQLKLTSDLFKDFPTLRFIIPHGGGAVPYHWGRFRGLAPEVKKPPLKDHLLHNVVFDTCVYHQPGIDLLTRVIPVDNILFASEMIGAVRGIDPETGNHYDDTKRYVEASGNLSAGDRHKIYESNARRVFPRLDAALNAKGR